MLRSGTKLICEIYIEILIEIRSSMKSKVFCEKSLTLTGKISLFQTPHFALYIYVCLY